MKNKRLFRNGKAELNAEGALWLIAITVVIIVLLFAASAHIIPKGNVGVVDYFGVVDDNELSPGFYLLNPLKDVEKINVQTQEHEFKQIENTLTKEGLKATFDASVIFHYEPSVASNLYMTVKGDPFDTLITPNFMGTARDEIKRWSAEDIYTGKSTEIQMDVQTRLSETLRPRGIIIESVLFRGLILPPEVTTAVESKIKEKQAVEQMRFTVEKQRGESERIIIEANATAQANRIKAASITPELIQWEFVQAIRENENAIYVPYGAQIILQPKNQ